MLTPKPRAFPDRSHAGRSLARALCELQIDRPVVLGLPRGGVPIAFEVATVLNAPLDVLVAHKIGAPGNPELGVGAIAEGEVQVLSDELITELRIAATELERSTEQAGEQVARQVRRYRQHRLPISLARRSAILLDDGLATGATARAAIRAARIRGAGYVILAAPVGAQATVEALRDEADEVLCLLEPEPMRAIGLWYEDFSQVTDAQVIELLARARGAGPG